MMARIRREDEARRAQRDQITTYGLVAVIVTFGGARYAGHRSIERACLALLGAFGLYAVAVRCGVPEMLPEYCVNGVDAGLERDRLRTTHRSRWPPWAPTPSPSCGCPSPTPTARTTTTAIFMRGVLVVPTRKTIRTNNLNTNYHFSSARIRSLNNSISVSADGLIKTGSRLDAEAS